jgi:Flp pilus assembly protein TadG
LNKILNFKWISDRKMKSLLKNIIRTEDGSSMLELAILLPVFLMMIVGALDLGAAFARKMEISNAAKAGAQYSLVRKPTQGGLGGIVTAVNDNLGTAANDSTAVDVSRWCRCDGASLACTSTCTGYQSVYITVAIKENFETPFFSYDWIVNNFPISEETTIQLD